MDESKEYIDMCAMAKDIQNNWNPDRGDFIFNKSANDNGHLFVNYLYQPYNDRPEWRLQFTMEDHQRSHVRINYGI